MNITDIPQSGHYFQEDVIVELVIQLIDEISGDPVPLQLATSAQIVVLFPDLVTTKVFTASLYSDGSDGRIAYITTAGDLTQVGLYRMQGIVVIGGIVQPASLETDFYCLRNIAIPFIPVVPVVGGGIITQGLGTAFLITQGYHFG